MQLLALEWHSQNAGGMFAHIKAGEEGGKWGKTCKSGQTKTAYLSWAFCYNFNFGLVHCRGSVSRLHSLYALANLVVSLSFLARRCLRLFVATARLCQHLKVHLFRSWPIFANYQTGLLQFFLQFLELWRNGLFWRVCSTSQVQGRGTHKLKKAT